LWDGRRFSPPPEFALKKSVPAYQGPHINILAECGPATVGEWLAKDNDFVRIHSSLVKVIQNNAPVQSISAPADGYLTIFAYEGAEVSQGEVIARLEKPD
jgi:hypothetical protein